MMRRVAIAVGLVSLLCSEAMALDCPPPLRPGWRNWVLDRIERGSFLALARIEHAVPHSDFDKEFGNTILKLKIYEVWPRRLADHVIGKSDNTYVKYSLWIYGSGEEYIFGSDSMRTWADKDEPSIWLLPTRKIKTKAFGLFLETYSASECSQMTVPRASEEFKSFLSELDAAGALTGRKRP
jgi:hypothetical protein